MQGVTLKSRAVAFAFCVGAVAFILSVTSASATIYDPQAIARALIAAIVCAVLSWASAERALSGVAEAVDGVIERVAAGAEGDLSSPTPQAVGRALPQLAVALDGMFDQVRGNLERATTMALFDPVTALPNRIHFRNELERAIKDLPETGIGALAFIDLDEFKAVNDSLGHASGDQVLAKVANRLRAVAAIESARHAGSAGETIVGRLAGDEFTVYFPRLEDRDDAARVGAALLEAIARPFAIGDQQVSVGASIGLALWPEDGTTSTTIMRAADVAMYHAKSQGRGQFHLYDDSLAERMAKRSQLESELRSAITNNEFLIVYQPQVSLSDGRLDAVEGLLRWNHPVDGLRLPNSFLRCAEESGLIHDIGDWAIDSLAQRVAMWPNNGLAPRMTVNLTARQIGRDDFFIRLSEALNRHKADLALIEFEIVESVLLDCGPATIQHIAQLREGGARVAIDNFGAGASSLSQLRALPFDSIKLDGSLIADIERDKAARELAQAVVSMIHSLGARAIAGGVETQGQLDVLRVMGCDAAQGYAIAPPMTEDDCRLWASNTRARIVA
jgi:diguanylate cyclase (GGDEF)-like protein